MHGYVWRLSKGWKVLGHLNNLASPLVIEVHVQNQESERTCTKPGKWKDMYKTRKVKGHVQNQESERHVQHQQN
jgi:hypothetical protein